MTTDQWIGFYFLVGGVFVFIVMAWRWWRGRG